ncbi:hypothetical protein BDV12DRAFT_198465 [Aspergillus spectabilis]
MGILSLAILIIIAAIVRITIVISRSRNSDITWMWMWSSIEATVANIIVCVASFRQLFVIQSRAEMPGCGPVPPMRRSRGPTGVGNYGDEARFQRMMALSAMGSESSFSREEFGSGRELVPR